MGNTTYYLPPSQELSCALDKQAEADVEWKVEDGPEDLTEICEVVMMRHPVKVYHEDEVQVCDGRCQHADCSGSLLPKVSVFPPSASQENHGRLWRRCTYSNPDFSQSEQRFQRRPSRLKVTNVKTLICQKLEISEYFQIL